MDTDSIGSSFIFWRQKIPDLMRGIGKGVREFNDAKEHVKNEIDAGMKEKDKPVLQGRKLQGRKL